MNAAADDSPLTALGRAIGFGVLIVGATVVFAFAAVAALVVGLMIAGAALALRLAPRPARQASGPDVLDAHPTPAGWVVETGTKRKS